MLRSLLTISITSFLLGFLFTHWIADSLTLWKSPVTDEHLWTAASYYAISAKAPSSILYFLVAVIALGITSISLSFRDGKAGNLMFDGGSIFLFCTSIFMYLFSVVPSVLAKFASLPSHQLKDPFPLTLRGDTLDLASNNLVCSVALTGVLALQAGRFWTESSVSDDIEFVDTSGDPSKSRARSPEVVS